MYTGMGEAKARPILSVDQNSGHVRVQCVARYLHCAQITGQFPDENLLHRLPLSNVHQQCRDDEMHMFRTGLMLHMFSGMCARYIRTLHPSETEGGGGGIQCGVQGMRRIFQRLGQRLRRANLSEYVSSSFVRAFSNFSAPGNRRQGAYQWGLTGAEAECLFFFVQFSLSGLVSGEISCCRSHAGGSARASPCDPTDDIVRVWSRFASWYMVIKTCCLSDHEVICRR